eukprot:205235-Pelagomonas_calceolata.AAC.3
MSCFSKYQEQSIEEVQDPVQARRCGRHERCFPQAGCAISVLQVCWRLPQVFRTPQTAAPQKAPRTRAVTYAIQPHEKEAAMLHLCNSRAKVD